MPFPPAPFCCFDFFSLARFGHFLPRCCTGSSEVDCTCLRILHKKAVAKPTVKLLLAPDCTSAGWRRAAADSARLQLLAAKAFVNDPSGFQPVDDDPTLTFRNPVDHSGLAVVESHPPVVRVRSKLDCSVNRGAFLFEFFNQRQNFRLLSFGELVEVFERRAMIIYSPAHTLARR